VASIHSVESTYSDNLPPSMTDLIGGGDEDKSRHFNDSGATMSFGSSAANMAMGGASPIDIVIKTQDLTKGKAIAENIAQLLRDKVPEAKEPSIDLQDGLPQIELVFDRERMYSLGLNAYTVGNELKAAVDGVTATQYRTSGNEYDVVLILPEADRSELPDLDRILS